MSIEALTRTTVTRIDPNERLATLSSFESTQRSASSKAACAPALSLARQAAAERGVGRMVLPGSSKLPS